MSETSKRAGWYVEAGEDGIQRCYWLKHRGGEGPSWLPVKFGHPGDARRACAALNACAPYSTEALESGALREVLGAAAILVDETEPAACARLAWSALRAALRALGVTP